MDEMNQVASALAGISFSDLTQAEKIIYKILEQRQILTNRAGEVAFLNDPEYNAYLDQMEEYSMNQELPEDF